MLTSCVFPFAPGQPLLSRHDCVLVLVIMEPGIWLCSSASDAHGHVHMPHSQAATRVVALIPHRTALVEATMRGLKRMAGACISVQCNAALFTSREGGPSPVTQRTLLHSRGA